MQIYCSHFSFVCARSSSILTSSAYASIGYVFFSVLIKKRIFRIAVSLCFAVCAFLCLRRRSAFFLWFKIGYRASFFCLFIKQNKTIKPIPFKTQNGFDCIIEMGNELQFVLGL